MSHQGSFTLYVNVVREFRNIIEKMQIRDRIKEQVYHWVVHLWFPINVGKLSM